MGQQVAHALIEPGCDERIPLVDALALPIVVNAGAVINFPVQRVEGLRSLVVLIYTLADTPFELTEFARVDDPAVARFSAIGAPIASARTVDDQGIPIQAVAVRRDTVGDLMFYRLTNVGGGALTVQAAGFRGVVL